MNNTNNAEASRNIKMPQLVLSTFCQTFFELPNGLIQVVQAGEKAKLISKQQFRNIEAVFNR